MDGVFRAVRWVMRGFDAADSERTVRPESPTSPNVEIGTYREKPPYPMLAGGLWSRHISIGRIWPWGNKACDGWKQPALPVTPERHLLRVGSASKPAVQTTAIFLWSLSPRELWLDICNVLCKRARFVGAKHVQTTSIRPRPMVVNKLN